MCCAIPHAHRTDFYNMKRTCFLNSNVKFRTKEKKYKKKKAKNIFLSYVVDTRETSKGAEISFILGRFTLKIFSI